MDNIKVKYTTKNSVWVVDHEANTYTRTPVSDEAVAGAILPYSDEVVSFEECALLGGCLVFTGVPGLGYVRSATVLDFEAVAG